ncbi:putative regulatory protein, FmdB family [Fervidobacterium pennivorans DSM 9078]|jgi:putative FmdB family regulatory protein|uniref:Regulatory protein, FmdB family n=1 Tax=Fervidobacterium pennivorans (strain DSM 9078 / Ven5) TaxID=771875 RepID=H9UCK4_FERPD|nr:FmdB family zinc ribbon protein [Fervidobacterium pennivorans]AFG35247.1 putative regulatory protein, FmdB family [Fervidobacterium pennivorans DSM 9078]QIV78390.1 FmdB family transcriptional regulator [Fervidobacterium pennivorans subsp. keratinolyticus]
MPMYRYVCENCGNEEVHMHGFNESPTISCSACGGRMTKTIGRVGIVFKGSGFYITDSRKSTTSKNENE